MPVFALSKLLVDCLAGSVDPHMVLEDPVGKRCSRILEGTPMRDDIIEHPSLGSQGEKTLQAVPGAKPAIITASRPITKMIVTQPKGLGSGSQPTTTTKIIPTKIVYGQQGKTQVSVRSP